MGECKTVLKIKIIKYDKEKEVGDISVLAAIKEQLELGIEDCINIKVTVFVGDIAGKIKTFISKEKWEERLKGGRQNKSYRL